MRRPPTGGGRCAEYLPGADARQPGSQARPSAAGHHQIQVPVHAWPAYYNALQHAVHVQSQFVPLVSLQASIQSLVMPVLTLNGSNVFSLTCTVRVLYVTDNLERRRMAHAG